MPRLRSLTPNTRLILGRLVPFAAVATAGALNVFLMRGEEIRKGIDIYPVLTEEDKAKREVEGGEAQSLGKSKKAATIAVAETAVSRVLNATPIMVLPPLLLVRLQKMDWLKLRPRMVLPVNLGMVSPSPTISQRSNVYFRTNLCYVDLCTPTRSGHIPSETVYQCFKARKGVLGLWRERWYGRVQSRNLIFHPVSYRSNNPLGPFDSITVCSEPSRVN